jgi:hypothetical protein
MANLGSSANLVFFLVLSCLVPLILEVFSLLWIGCFGYSFDPYFGLLFLWSSGMDFMFGIPVENMVVWQPWCFKTIDNLIVGGALLKINPSQIWFFLFWSV